MSTPQKSLFSLLSFCQKNFYNRSKFGKVMTKNKFAQFFETRCISALKGCCALKFLHALEIDQALIAHTRSGTGVPPKKIVIVKIKNRA